MRAGGKFGGWFLGIFILLLISTHDLTESFWAGIVAGGLALLWRRSEVREERCSVHYHYHAPLEVEPFKELKEPARKKKAKKAARKAGAAMVYDTSGMDRPWSPAARSEHLRYKQAYHPTDDEIRHSIQPTFYVINTPRRNRNGS